MKQFQMLLIVFLSQVVHPIGSVHAQTNKQEQALSFEEALALTKSNNGSIKQADALVSQRRYESKATTSLFFPKVTLGANAVYLPHDLHLDLTPVRDAITPLYQALGTYGNFSGVPNPDPNTASLMPILPDNISTQAVRANLLEGLDAVNAGEWDKLIQKNKFATISASFTQPIFMGGKILLANRAAGIKENEALLQKTEKTDLIYKELIQRYYALVISKSAEQVRTKVFNTMEIHLNDASKMKDEGIIANAEYLHAKVYYSEAQRELKKAARQVDIVNQSLLNTVSLDSVVDILPVSGLFYTHKLEDLEYYVNSAIEYSPLLLQIEKKIELAQTARMAEKSDYLPTIAAFGTYDIYNKDLSPYAPEYMVGVGVSWKLSHGLSRIHKVKAADYQVEQAEYYMSKASSDIETVLIKYYQEIQMHLEQLDEIKDEMVFAEEYFRVKNKAFSEGISTSTEVTDASLQLAKVKIDQLKVAYDYIVALSQLLYYSGDLEFFVEIQKHADTVYLN